MTNDAKSFYLILHTRDCDDSSIKIIGLYSSERRASDAIARLSKMPGFRDYPSGFHVDRYILDRDNWSEGFGDP